MKIAIIGLGLIGGSIGLALKGKCIYEKIIGIGRDLARLKKAIEIGAVDDVTTELGKGIEDVDLVIVATPVKAILDIVPRIAPCLKDGAVVTDVGSTKAEITYTLTGTLGQGIHFVGGHPMAGRESSGIEGATGDLFSGAVCILTPVQDTDRGAISIVRSMWEGIGARVIEMSPSEHDRLVGLTSHLPHLLATELVRLVSGYDKDGTDLKPLIGKGFKDMTRIAKGSPDMWTDICLTNKDTLLNLLDRFKERLDHLHFLIKDGMRERLMDEFSKARDWRNEIS